MFHYHYGLGKLWKKLDENRKKINFFFPRNKKEKLVFLTQLCALLGLLVKSSWFKFGILWKFEWEKIIVFSTTCCVPEENIFLYKFKGIKLRHSYHSLKLCYIIFDKLTIYPTVSVIWCMNKQLAAEKSVNMTSMHI